MTVLTEQQGKRSSKTWVPSSSLDDCGRRVVECRMYYGSFFQPQRRVWRAPDAAIEPILQGLSARFFLEALARLLKSSASAIQ